MVAPLCPVWEDEDWAVFCGYPELPAEEVWLVDLDTPTPDLPGSGRTGYYTRIECIRKQLPCRAT